MSVGSKSTITQRGTCFPAPVSEKNLGFPSTHSTNVIQSAHERNRKKNVYSTCQNQNGVFAKLLVANTRHKRQRSVSYIGNTLWDVELVISVATSIPRSLQRAGHWANFCPIACEQRVESIITAADSLVRRHLTIWLDAMFQAEQLPARVADLNTWLTKT